MKESCPENKAGVGLWQLLGLSELWLRYCCMLIAGRRQSIPKRTATSQMLKAVNMDLPCDSAGWCHALLSQWVSHWEIKWFSNHLSPEYFCVLHLRWIQCECDLNGLYMEITLALVTFVAGLQCLSPVHTIFAESHYISVSVKLSLSVCIFGNTYNSTHPTMGG